MNKPTWKHAPDWAQYLAQDPNGDWYWYEVAPISSSTKWVEQSNSGRIQKALPGFVNGWKTTLEQRP